MTNLTKKLRRRRKGLVARMVRKAEDKVLIAQGRKALRRKVERVGKVSRKAARAGLIAGTAAAAVVIRREFRRSGREA